MLTVCALLAAFLVGAPQPATADDPGPPPPVVYETDQALQVAQQTGQTVEIASARTETSQVFAQPDGTQRLVVAARPVRVLQGSQWVDAQPKLVRRADGTIGPVASTLDMTFSGGGTGYLVRVDREGVTLTYTWPTPLPAPVLAGTAATYAEVIPGVDLVLNADVEGFSEVLVVKTAEAAARPELAELRIAVHVSGGTLRRDAGGNLTLIADDGTVALHGAAPRMWDSSGDALEDGDRRTGPRTGDAVGEIATSLDGGVLTLAPDLGFLRDPDLTFPVYIDPPMHGAARLAFTYVSKHFAGTKFFNTSDVAKVGYVNDPNVPSGPTIDTYRSFFRMNTAPVNGKHIISAVFRTFEVHSWSCNARPVELWTTGAIGTGTTWNAQPGWSSKISTVNVAKGYNSNCADGGVDFPATSAVVTAASRGWPNLTLGLRASNESDTFGWKKFRNNPTLEITYNSTPNVPDQRSADIGASVGVPCAAGAAAPYVTTTTPTLRARVQDPDAAKGQNVRAHFEWWATGGSKAGENFTAYVKSGTPVTAAIPSGAFADGARISWRVRGQDGVATSGNSDWSPWCELIVDRTRPSGAPVVTSADYPETPEGGDPVPSGGIGRMGTFTLRPATADADIGGFLYALNDDAPGAAATAAISGGQATVRLTPSRDLLNVLYVWSRDRAGNIGPFKRYEFSVRAGAGPVARWTLDEGAGTAVADSSGGNGGTLTGGATWTSGRDGRAVRLNGTDGRIELARTTPLVATELNYSVAAWVRLTDKSDYRTILSQDGNTRSGFYLQYSLSTDRWAMVVTSADSPSVTYNMAKSDAPPQLGVWTHLAATFDAATGLIRLYVNGRPQAATAVQATPWHAGGRFAIGRALGLTNPWAGDVDEVRAYDRVIYAPEVAALATRPPVLEGHWKFDETSGTTVADSSGRGRTGTATGMTWDEGWVGGAGSFTGTGHVSTAGPAIRTDQSFTVAAWLRLDAKGDYRTAVSQDGVNRSGFYFQYNKTVDRWAIYLTQSDAAGAPLDGALSSEPPTLGEWTHLAATYDYATGKLQLYVNGNPEGSGSHLTTWNAGGRLAIGRALGATNLWHGLIDDVRVYTGVLSEDEIFDLALQ
ncbi:hypothetical protein Aph01nite_10980 [Acrocarpospora phusangensis]|uniref:LamG-like jellyroll fold domain-containing protein n=1 Tax=Acrocarpospora phusangensis TaxID=1070424 RepID=A0A919UM08_9ACTN|nr:hypothetical protein Aph01nite_10980 [Acrocarpospora phusangensis]